MPCVSWAVKANNAMKKKISIDFEEVRGGEERNWEGGQTEEADYH